MFRFLLLLTFTINLSAKSITTKITHKDCKEDKITAFFVYYKKTPKEYLFQAEVPAGGNVGFNLKDNHKYEILGVTKSGCSGTKEVDLTKKDAANYIELFMEKN